MVCCSGLLCEICQRIQVVPGVNVSTNDCPKDAMKGITSETRPEWLHVRYRGTREALIHAGVATSSMFATMPKRVKHGWIDEDTDAPRSYESRRTKGGIYELKIQKTNQHQECDRERSIYPPVTNSAEFWARMVPWLGAVLGVSDVAAGRFKNMNGYYLDNQDEIQRLVDQLIETVQAGRIRKREDKPKLSVVR